MLQNGKLHDCVISPMYSIHACDSWCDSDITSCQPPAEVWPQIIYAKFYEAKNYHINLKSGVNFQVALRQNHAERNCILPDNLHHFLLRVSCMTAGCAPPVAIPHCHQSQVPTLQFDRLLYQVQYLKKPLEVFYSSLQSCITHNEHTACCTLKVYKLNMPMGSDLQQLSDKIKPLHLLPDKCDFLHDTSCDSKFQISQRF